jgi:hypothetical protein
MLAAVLAAAAVYLATAAPLHRRGGATNWTTFLLVTTINLALTTALVVLATASPGP